MSPCIRQSDSVCLCLLYNILHVDVSWLVAWIQHWNCWLLIVHTIHTSLLDSLPFPMDRLWINFHAIRFVSFLVIEIGTHTYTHIEPQTSIIYIYHATSHNVPSDFRNNFQMMTNFGFSVVFIVVLPWFAMVSMQCMWKRPFIHKLHKDTSQFIPVFPLLRSNIFISNVQVRIFMRHVLVFKMPCVDFKSLHIKTKVVVNYSLHGK